LIVGKLLGLNEEQMENAVGIAGSHDMVLGILDAPGEVYTMAKNSRFPFTAHSGIMGALLAQQGFTGPARVLEGNRGFVQTVMKGEFDLERLVQGDGSFRILDTSYKLITADYTTHGHLTATLTLVKENDIKPEDIAQVKLRASTRDVDHTGDWAKRYPTNKESADHSSYWLTAMAIIYRVVGPSQFTEENYRNPKVKELIDKVTMEADSEMESFVAAGISEITTNQGVKYSCRVDYPKGDPHNPVSDQELEEKYRPMALEFMGEDQMNEGVATIYDLENLDDVGNLMKTMVFPH
jgi:2-methylcitrate dehydratase